MNKEERLSRYIDMLNRNRAPLEHRLGSPDEEGVYAAVRALRGLREGDCPRPCIRRRLLARLGTPVVTQRLQAGLIRTGLAVGLVVIVGVVASLVVTAQRPSAVDHLLTRVRAAAAGMATSGIQGYHATFVSAFGEEEILFLAPDRFLAHRPETAWTYGSDGVVTFIVCPSEPAVVTKGGGPLRSILPPGLSWAPDYLTYYRNAPGYTVVQLQDTEIAGRKAHTLGVSLAVGTTDPGSAPTSGHSRYLYGVDAETGLVLEIRELDADGNTVSLRGFTSISFASPDDPGLFDMSRWIPDGTPVTQRQIGPLPELAEAVGLITRQPRPATLGAWAVAEAELCLFPGGGWQLGWSYRRSDPVDPAELYLRKPAASVRASDRPIQRNEYRGEAIDLGGSVTAWYVEGLGLLFASDGIFYEVRITPGIRAENDLEEGASLLSAHVALARDLLGMSGD